MLIRRRLSSPLIPFVPELPPRRGYGPLHGLGRGWLRLAGWRVEGNVPDLARCVVAVAPHSSNWDFVHAVAAVFALGLRISFIGKHTLFRGSLGTFMRWLGGMPVDRSRPNGLVEDMVEAFAHAGPLWLAIAPEGTRTRVEGFKSGFYRIALAARVPILPVAINYRSRSIILLPAVVAQAEVERGVGQMQTLFAAYGARKG